MMEGWLRAAIEYACSWIEHQARAADLPGCAFAVHHAGSVVAEASTGVADVRSREPLTPRHRFRVASLSKTVTAVGVLRLVEQGHVGLSAPVGHYVAGLHPAVSDVTIEQLLSHRAGLSRDGRNSGYFADVVPFPDRERVLQQLARPPVIAAGEQAKYSNLGYALLGLVIERITGSSYAEWIPSEVLGPLGLHETSADAGEPGSAGAPLARGHSGRLPVGRRVVIPADNPTHAFAPVTGLVSSAADMARLYGTLAPHVPGHLLSAESRRVITTPVVDEADTADARSYALGTHGGHTAGWQWFGHIGLFQGSAVRAVAVPTLDLAFVVAVNAMDGDVDRWADGVLHILERFSDGGAPAGPAADWTGRWWNLWGATDLVAIGDHVLATDPLTHPPLTEASVITLDEPDRGRIVASPVVHRLGETAVRHRDDAGDVLAVKLGGVVVSPEEMASTYIRTQYEPGQDGAAT